MASHRQHFIPPRVMTAPLAGVSDPAFQRILHLCRAPVISSEMIPSEALIRNPYGLRSIRLLESDIHPISMQVFGSRPEVMGQAAGFLATLGADFIDINMGCPSRKIVSAGAGLALMREKEKAYRIMETVRQSVDIPVSVKFRLGWEADKPLIFDFLEIVDRLGINFIIVHARYRQGYDIPADWSLLREVKRQSGIPVIGNGDIFSPQDALQMIEHTGCDGVMIARGLLGYPWLPREVNAFLSGNPLRKISPDERFAVIREHLRLLIRQHGERHGCFIFRKHAVWYLKRINVSGRTRKTVVQCDREDCFLRIFRSLLKVNA